MRLSRVQNATSEDRCMWGTAYNDDRISKKKRFKKKKIKRFFFLFQKKRGGSLIRACSLIRSNTVIQIMSVCLCVCLSSIGGQTAGPIMTKFGTHMRIDLGMVPTKKWPHEWPGGVGSLGPISESGLSCSFFCEPLCGKWRHNESGEVMTSFSLSSINQCQWDPWMSRKSIKQMFTHPTPGGSSVPGGFGGQHFKCEKFHELPKKSIKKKILPTK